MNLKTKPIFWLDCEVARRMGAPWSYGRCNIYHIPVNRTTRTAPRCNRYSIVGLQIRVSHARWRRVVLLPYPSKQLVHKEIICDFTDHGESYNIAFITSIRYITCHCQNLRDRLKEWVLSCDQREPLPDVPVGLETEWMTHQEVESFTQEYRE